MATKTVKIDEDTHRWLVSLSGEFQRETGKPISIDKALKILKEKTYQRQKLSDLAGSWQMDDEEAEMIKKRIKKGWRKWKISA